jgi:hypothetical protein
MNTRRKKSGGVKFQLRFIEVYQSAPASAGASAHPTAHPELVPMGFNSTHLV